MISFAEALKKHGLQAEETVHAAFVKATELVADSILNGSELTGAPGQPVITGNLKNSFQPEFTSRWSWRITTNVSYAEAVELGANDRAFFDPSRQDGRDGRRSEVGGYLSIRLTEVSFADAIMPAAVEFARKQNRDGIIAKPFLGQSTPGTFDSYRFGVQDG